MLSWVGGGEFLVQPGILTGDALERILGGYPLTRRAAECFSLMVVHSGQVEKR